MRIGLDIMGSDHGPDVPIRGAVLASRELPSDTRLVLIGDAATIEKGLRSEGADASAFDIVPSVDDITMQRQPHQSASGQAEAAASASGST
jgi:glycerol-3-phosphate acyltransferase PlsX